MRFRLVFAILIGLSILVDCSNRTAQSGNVRVLQTKENAKYKLAIRFYGEEINVQEGRRAAVIRYITLNDERTGTEIRYQAFDEASLSTSGGFFSDVWSPDQEFLVLPLGRFEGFSIAASREAVQRVSSNHFDDFIRVELSSGVKLWHEFKGWNSADSFNFSAGLSDQQMPFTYAIRDHKLTAPNRLSPNFIGVNAQGKLPIVNLASSTGH